jgi:hypothetical protein
VDALLVEELAFVFALASGPDQPQGHRLLLGCVTRSGFAASRHQRVFAFAFFFSLVAGGKPAITSASPA